MIGKMVTSSGFEDTIYQADMCTTGSVNGVLSGKHYNNAWIVHESFAEAVDRLFCRKYVNATKSLDAKVKKIKELSPEKVKPILESKNMKAYYETYEIAKGECLKGEYGKHLSFGWVC